MRLLLHKVPAAHGQRWIAQGWQAFRKAPLSLTALTATYFIAHALLELLGLVGSLLRLVSAPLLTLVFMLAVHRLLQSKPIRFSVWAEPFRLTRQRSLTLIQLGLLFMVAAVGVQQLSSWVGGEDLQRFERAAAAAMALEDPKAAQEALGTAMTEASQSPSVQMAQLVGALGMLIISLPFWHAPALVHWGGHGAGKALFSSLVAIWTNRGAFLVNGLLWLLISAFMALLLLLAASLLGLQAALALLGMPLTLLLLSVLGASVYFTFVDCFRFAAEPSA